MPYIAVGVIAPIAYHMAPDRLRILQVTEALMPGGTLNVFIRRALGFADRGHHVAAVLPDTPQIDVEDSHMPGSASYAENSATCDPCERD
jgi:hypothetical protein